MSILAQWTNIVHCFKWYMFVSTQAHQCGNLDPPNDYADTLLYAMMLPNSYGRICRLANEHKYPGKVSLGRLNPWTTVTKFFR